MPEYIEREALRQEIERIYQKHFAKSKEKFIKDTFKAMFKRIDNAHAADVIEVGSCEGCYWKGMGRFQKCTYCRRNRNLKDRYLKEGAFDD